MKGSSVTIIYMVLLLGAVYFLILRPSRARQRQALALRAQLSVGSEVMTGSGVYGTVVSIEDDVIVLEVAPGVTMRWAKAAVNKVLTSGPEAADTAGTEALGRTGDDGIDAHDARDADGDDDGRGGTAGA